MDSQAKQSYIREKANENLQTSDASKILWSRHAIAALIDDNLDRIEVETALQQSEVIEDYPLTHRPLPDCLVLAAVSPSRPIHVVIAIDQSHERIFIVTVYIPIKDKWYDDWRTRKR
jgi:hypothetical protein